MAVMALRVGSLAVMGLSIAACDTSGSPVRQETDVDPEWQPKPVVQVRRFADEVSCATTTACADFSDGTIRCWGQGNGFGIGEGKPRSTLDFARPVKVINMEHASRVAVAAFHVCALQFDGTASCWGENVWGQLGPGGPPLGSFFPASILAVSGIIQIAVSGVAAYALDDHAQLWAWGRNDLGELGNGTTDQSLDVVHVMDDVVSVAARLRHACAAKKDGSVWCWGSNENGEAGTGEISVYNAIPNRVEGMSGAIGVSVGDKYGCAWTEAGSMLCWGDNRFGQLGGGKGLDRPFAEPVEGMADVVSVAAGYDRTCAVRSDRTVLCVGGAFSSFDIDSTPVPVEGLGEVQSLSVSDNYACAVRYKGKVVCWGLNLQGRLGRPGPSSDTPSEVLFEDL